MALNIFGSKSKKATSTNSAKTNEEDKTFVNYLIAGGGSGAMVSMTYFAMMDAYFLYTGKDDARLNIILPEVDQQCTEAKMLEKTSKINGALKNYGMRTSDTTVQPIQLADTMKANGAQTYYSLDEKLFEKELFQSKYELDNPIEGFYRVSTTAAMAAPLCNKKFIEEIESVCREIAEAANDKAIRIGVVASTWGSEGQHFLNSAIPEIIKKTKEILAADKGIRGDEAEKHIRNHLETALFLIGPCNRYPTGRMLDDDVEARNIGFLQFLPDQLIQYTDKYFLFDHDTGTISADSVELKNDQKKHFTALELDAAYVIYMYFSGRLERKEVNGNVFTSKYGTPKNNNTDRDSITLDSDMWKALDSRLRWDACLFYAIRPELGSSIYSVDDREWMNSTFVSTFYRRTKKINSMPGLDRIRRDIIDCYSELIQREEDYAKIMRDIAFTHTKWNEQDSDRVFNDRDMYTKLYSFKDIEKLSPLKKTIEKASDENKLKEMNRPDYDYMLDRLTDGINNTYDTRLSVREVNDRLKKSMKQDMTFSRVVIELYRICRVTGGRR